MPTVSLSASEYSEFENTSSVTVTVVRGGDLDSAAAVRLQTVQLETVDNPAIGILVIPLCKSMTIALASQRKREIYLASKLIFSHH